MEAFNNLVREVSETKGKLASFKVFTAGIASRLRAALANPGGINPAEVQALADSLDGEQAALDQAMLDNDVPEPAPPNPVPNPNPGGEV